MTMWNQDSLKSAFEKYMIKFYQENKCFSINDFADFAITLLNYQINAQLLERVDKKEAAYYLATLYNKGMGNRITEKDLQSIVTFIDQDYALDLQILKKITD